MKTVLKLAFTLLFITGFNAAAQERKITLKELPANAQSFLSKHFPNQAPSYVEEDKGMLSTDYKVLLTGGTEIEFDGKGNWEEVDGNKTAIPNSIAPKGVNTYISENYKGREIEKIEKENWGYKVELLNDVELVFDSNGRFLRLDN